MTFQNFYIYKKEIEPEGYRVRGMDWGWKREYPIYKYRGFFMNRDK